MTPVLATTLLTATVVVTCGVLFLLETLARRDTLAGRIWSMAFLAGILTVVCYLLWAIAPDGRAWIAISFGNAALVATVGCLWLGASALNGHRLRWTVGAVLVLCLVTMAAALAEGPDGGDWAGGVAMFLSVAVVALGGAIETRRGRMGETILSLALTAVLGITAGYYLGRTVVFVVVGPDSTLFQTYFGGFTTAVLTVVLTIVAMMTGSILRGRDSARRRSEESEAVSAGGADVLAARAFDRATTAVISRAEANAELFALIVLRMDDLPQIGMAFGTAAQAEVAAQWRDGVRRYAPSMSIVGEGGPTTMLVALQPSTAGEARRIASRIHRRVIDVYTGSPETPTPVMGVGVAVSETFGYDGAALRRAAEDAAFVSAASPDASVVVAGLS
ncbi:hypothetical protein ABZ477_16710 [Microbacterium sp. NPDC019599]|uniref:hypothetical protein n=1 Tax=Microbacterium sp. NPDC019599 TaxID=3154690 RepID=UPI0033E5E623